MPFQRLAENATPADEEPTHATELQMMREQPEGKRLGMTTAQA